MKIEQLQQLLQIVAEGSMNEAAQKLYVARSSLSTSMKNLETELGAPIFERTTRGVTLTAFGRDVYQQAQEICQRFSFLQSMPKAGRRTHLSVSSLYCSIANDAFVELYSRHFEDGLTCNMEECMLPDVLRQVSTGLTEIGVITIFSDIESLIMRRIEDAGLEFNLILRRPLHAIVGPNNPLYSKTEDGVTLEDLRDYPCVINYASPGDVSGERVWEGQGRRNAEVLVSDLGSALKIVERTTAIAIDTYDAETYQMFYAGNRSRFLPLKDAPLDCKLGWLKIKGRVLSPICEEYLQILQEKARATGC